MCLNSFLNKFKMRKFISQVWKHITGEWIYSWQLFLLVSFFDKCKIFINNLIIQEVDSCEPSVVFPSHLYCVFWQNIFFWPTIQVPQELCVYANWVRVWYQELSDILVLIYNTRCWAFVFCFLRAFFNYDDILLFRCTFDDLSLRGKEPVVLIWCRTALCIWFVCSYDVWRLLRAKHTSFRAWQFFLVLWCYRFLGFIW